MEKSLLITFLKITAVQLVMTLIVTVTSYASGANAQELLDRRINVTIEQTSLKNALTQLSQLADVKFVFNSRIIRSDERVSITARNERLQDLLTRLLTPRHIQFGVSGRQIIFSRTDTQSTSGLPEVAKEEKIVLADVAVTGTVFDEKNSGLPGVSVVLKGTSRGSTTNANGQYRIDVPASGTGSGPVTLIFSSIGYKRQEILVGKQIVVDATLQPDDQTLNEVVVVGFGT